MNTLKLIVLTTVYLFYATGFVFSQQIAPAPKEKSVVYIVMTQETGILDYTTYFDGDKIIGGMNSQTCIRYECEPREHYFWANSENKSYIKANVLAGKIYVFEVLNRLDGIKIIPINKQSKRLKKIQKLLSWLEPENFSPARLKTMQEKYQKRLDRGLKRLELLKNTNYSFETLTPSMYLEPKDLKYEKKKKKRKKKKS